MNEDLMLYKLNLELATIRDCWREAADRAEKFAGGTEGTSEDRAEAFGSAMTLRACADELDETKSSEAICRAIASINAASPYATEI